MSKNGYKFFLSTIYNNDTMKLNNGDSVDSSESSKYLYYWYLIIIINNHCYYVAKYITQIDSRFNS